MSTCHSRNHNMNPMTTTTTTTTTSTAPPYEQQQQQNHPPPFPRQHATSLVAIPCAPSSATFRNVGLRRRQEWKTKVECMGKNKYGFFCGLVGERFWQNHDGKEDQCPRTCADSSIRSKMIRVVHASLLLDTLSLHFWHDPTKLGNRCMLFARLLCWQGNGMTIFCKKNSKTNT